MIEITGYYKDGDKISDEAILGLLSAILHRPNESFPCIVEHQREECLELRLGTSHFWLEKKNVSTA